jgi:glutamate transport system substrate-binding protein
MTEGDPTGFDVDVAAYVAYKLGYSPYDIEWVEVRPDNREELLDTGAVDMVVAAYSITDERAEQVHFAGPYLLTGQDLLVRAEDTEINGPGDIAGKTLCEVTGSTSDERVRELFGDGVQIVEKPQYTDCARAVVTGEVDATSTDDIILAGLAASDEFFALVRLVGEPFSAERYGIGLPAGSTERCAAINDALVEMVTDGSWQRFIDRHTAGTGYSPTEYGNPPPVEPCGGNLNP